MKVWVTRYWDTQGIYSVEVRDEIQNERYVYTKVASGSLPQQFILNRDAFVNRADADRRVYGLRAKKIAALKKKIEKLEKMKI